MEFHPPKADICKHCCCCCCSGFQTGKRAFGIDSHFSHTIFIDEIFGKWLCNELHFNSFIGNFIMHALRCKVSIQRPNFCLIGWSYSPRIYIWLRLYRERLTLKVLGKIMRQTNRNERCKRRRNFELHNFKSNEKLPGNRLFSLLLWRC